MNSLGLSGKIAQKFITSKLTPLFIIISLCFGFLSLLKTSREEEPQINVPIIDVIVTLAGASPTEIESRITRPLEKFLWEIKGIEYIYSTVRPGVSLTSVRFFVGENMGESIVKLTSKLKSYEDLIPPGVSQPLVKPKSIDDVPILTLTLWSNNPTYSGYELRRIADEICNEIMKDPDVEEAIIFGGQRRQIKIALDPLQLKAYSISSQQIITTLQKANIIFPSGTFPHGKSEYLVETQDFLRTADDINALVIGTLGNRAIYLRDVAKITDGAEEPKSYVFIGLGTSGENQGTKSTFSGDAEAVTIAISKKNGADATTIADATLKKVELLKGKLFPSDIEITVTRNYGETAKAKSDELLEHMLIATLSVITLILFTLGWREAVVVSVSIPVTLALTLFVNYMYGYTLNRVTLFGLIFSIGILVDDAIVVIENMHRHFKLNGIKILAAVRAVDEVGNSTILATFTVIAALLPMAFISGLMGPYMRPIPVGASTAMLFSLIVAFTVSPWLYYKIFNRIKASSEEPQNNKKHGLFAALITPLLNSKNKRLTLYGFLICLFLLSLLLIPLKAVKVKMLPFDNKSELQVIIDMPEGTSLEETAAMTSEMGRYLKTVPEVTNYERYVGTASPFNFNGLVRHYFSRSGSNIADLQVNFVPKKDRSDQSHEIAKRLRPPLKEIGDKYNARIKVLEIPAGPPVLSTLAAEIYGPDTKRQIEIAQEIKKIFQDTEGVVDVDMFVEEDQPKIIFEINKKKAAHNGITATEISAALKASLGGEEAGLVHLENEKEPVIILLRAPLEKRTDLSSLKEIAVPSPNGVLIPLSELVDIKYTIENKTIYRKNLKNVTYVVGNVAGTIESPIYAILKMQDNIKSLKLPEGYELTQYFSSSPLVNDKYRINWDGEWHITYEVFRDLGLAFGVVLVLIYIMVVAWFRSLATPLVIMAPIPLTLIGILPGHWLLGAFFTATSMIGFIALAGIVVRNSILLVDFIEKEWKQTGRLQEALIMAVVIRFRPIALTAAAVVIGSVVMLFDPIFQGLAISMMFGAVAATTLTLIIVPLVYYEIFKDNEMGD